jgi:hypothetical protein
VENHYKIATPKIFKNSNGTFHVIYLKYCKIFKKKWKNNSPHSNTIKLVLGHTFAIFLQICFYEHVTNQRKVLFEMIIGATNHYSQITYMYQIVL